MTDVSSIINSVVAGGVAATASTNSEAISAATKVKLEQLKIDTTNITTEAEAKAAIAKAEKAAEKQTAKSQEKEIQDVVELSKTAQNLATS